MRASRVAGARDWGAPAPNGRLCGESVTGNLRNTTTPAPGPSPVVLPMLFMVNAAGLAIPAAIVVLCRFLAGAMAPARARAT